MVARVAGETIERSDVEEFAAKLLPGLQSEKEGREARLEYLQTLIDEKLLVIEARALGLDTTRTLERSVQQRFSKQVLEHYRPRHLYPQIEITEAEVRERFIQDGLNRERAVRRMIVTTLEEANQLRRQVEEQGADFAELARAHTLETSQGAEGGYLGFMNVEMAFRYQVPRQPFTSLPVGELSQPLPLGGAFQIILFEDEREGDLGRSAGEIQHRLWQERLSLLTRATTEALAAELGLSMSSEGVTAMLGKKVGLGTRRYPKLTPREAARREGYHELAPMIEWKERETIDQLIKALRQRTLDERVVVTDEQAEQFYADNPRFFTEPADVQIQEILVADPHQAAQVRQRLEAGEEMDALINLTLHPRSKRNRGIRHVHSWERSELAKQAFAAQEGALVGPVEAAHGHSVFRVLKKGGGRLLPFEKVAARAATHVRYRQEARAFNKLLAELRPKYAERVQIFEEELDAVQLPAKADTPAPQ